MVKIEKREISTCCGKKQLIWRLNISLNKNHCVLLKQAGFSFFKSYYDSGMLYAEDKGLIASGVFGLNELNIKCKNEKCNDSVRILEEFILKNFHE